MSKENGATELKCFIWVVKRQNHCGSRLFIVPGPFFWPIHYWLLWILVFISLFIISLVHASGLLLSFSIAWKIARSLGEVEYITVVDSGGGTRPPPLPSFIFRPNRGPKSRKKLRPHPLISGSGWRSPPPLSEGLDPPLYKAQLLNFSQFEKGHLEPGDFPHWHCVRSPCLARSVILMNFSKYEQTKPK